MVEKQYELSLLGSVHVEPYIAISHIYDTLFDPSERAGKKKLWNKIVNFIQYHESRMHLEIHLINGEETHFWKWIVAALPGLSFLKHFLNLLILFSTLFKFYFYSQQYNDNIRRFKLKQPTPNRQTFIPTRPAPIPIRQQQPKCLGRSSLESIS